MNKASVRTRTSVLWFVMASNIDEDSVTLPATSRILKKYSYDLIKHIGSHESTCLVVALELYSRDLIGEALRNSVVQRAKFASTQVAAEVVTALEDTLKHNPDTWETILEALDANCSTPIIEKMRDEAAVQQVIPAPSVNLVATNQHHFEVASQNTKPQRGLLLLILIYKVFGNNFLCYIDLSKYEKQVNRRVELVSKIGVLEYLFQQLLLSAACGIDNSYVERIVLVLVQAISRHNENTHLSDYVEELEGIKNVSEIIQYLVKNHFCGCLNYILLANLIEAFGNEECKETLSEYIEEYNKFAKDVKLAELIQPYLTDAEISKGCLIGLPEIVLTVENPGSWMQRAYSTFSSVWNSLVSPVRYFLKSVGAGSLEITHAIFPEDFPTVKENLEKNRSFLEKLGIKARIVMDPNNPHVTHHIHVYLTINK